jgi:glycerol-3-phosphate dehydrogenase (NAD(P)+)
MRLAVIGAGSWGSTFASLAAARCETVIWAREPDIARSISIDHLNDAYLPGVQLSDGLRATASLEEAASDSDVVVMAVPVQYLRAVARRVRPFVRRDAVLISLAKGIEQRTLSRPSEVLREELHDHDEGLIGVLSGPNLAREIVAGQPAATVVAMPDPNAARTVQVLLMTDRFRIYTSGDVVGCEIGGAVKNVIAIAAGIADGLGLGWNARAALITRGLAELTRLGVALGGEALTFLGLAGNGDLIATCSSPQSRNRRVGVELGKGRSLDDILADTNMVAEGVTSAPAVLALARRHEIDLPIAEQVQAVLSGERTPIEILERLMRRDGTTELHDLPHVRD